MKIVVVLALISPTLTLPPRKATKIPFQEISGRIVNGSEAFPNQFPWQAAIRMDEQFFCGGAIISSDWILTAGHCVYRYSVFRVTIGTNDIVSPDLESTQLMSSELFWHQNFDLDSLANDIGLISLPRRLAFDGIVQAIALDSRPLGVGVLVTVSGWGRTSDDSYISQTLRYVMLLTISNESCSKEYEGIFAEMVCAKAPGKSICNGDSGSPLVMNPATNPVHVGIASFSSSRGCEENYSSGFTRTAYFRQWIREKTGI